MKPWLLVPVKSLAAGKSRLASVLEQGALRKLNETLLRHVLKTASRFPGRARTAVVSRCEAALELAAACGARAIRQASRPGLNPAAAEGLEAVRRAGAGAVILMACDLPLVRPSDIREIADLGSQLGGLLVCPDRHWAGTNAMYIPAGCSPRFRFGADSLHKHMGEALRAGMATGVHFNTRLACDIDTPEDLRRWRRAGARRRIPAPRRSRT